MLVELKYKDYEYVIPLWKKIIIAIAIFIVLNLIFGLNWKKWNEKSTITTPKMQKDST